MSINVALYPKTPYRQTPIAWPVSLFNPPAQKPAAVVLKFDWLVYWTFVTAQLGAAQANIAVQVDLNSGGTSQGPTLDKIVTVKIDNSNSLNSILVHFPDSGDTISCAPQTIVTLPCVTNAANCYVIGQGLATGFLPLTTVTFYNYFVPPSVDPVLQLVYPQWLGSPAVQRNQSQLLTPGYAPPALGDQIDNFSAAAGGQVRALWGTPRAAGTLVITTMTMKMASGFPAQGVQQNSLSLVGSVSGTLVQLIITSTGATLSVQEGLNISGLQTRLDPTEAWTVTLPNLNGASIIWFSAFTYKPD